jgi:hypothetical protein
MQTRAATAAASNKVTMDYAFETENPFIDELKVIKFSCTIFDLHKIANTALDGISPIDTCAAHSTNCIGHR